LLLGLRSKWAEVTKLHRQLLIYTTFSFDLKVAVPTVLARRMFQLKVPPPQVQQVQQVHGVDMA